MWTTSRSPTYIQCTGKPNSGCGPERSPSTRAYQSRVASMSSAATRMCSMWETGMHRYISGAALYTRSGPLYAERPNYLAGLGFAVAPEAAEAPEDLAFAVA